MTDNWTPTIKWLRDNILEFHNATVIVAGWNAKNLRQDLGKLAGRRGKVIDVNRSLLPMGFRSFCHVLAPELAKAGINRLPTSKLHSAELVLACEELLVWSDILFDSWESYLHYGGYPQSAAAAQAGDDVPVGLLDSLFDVVFHDTFATSRLSKLDTLALFSRITKGIAKPINVTAIATACDFPRESIKRRLEDLVDNYLLWRCHQVNSALQQRLRGQNKLYFTDPLLARLAHAQNSAWDAPDLTALVEQQIGLALIRGMEADDPGHLHEHDRIGYHRTESGSEIDFVGECLAGAALESKYTEGGKWAGDARTVNASAWAGVLATRNVLDTSGKGDAAWAVPAPMLAYLLDT